jgi:hypothetical protein
VNSFPPSHRTLAFSAILHIVYGLCYCTFSDTGHIKRIDCNEFNSSHQSWILIEAVPLPSAGPRISHPAACSNFDHVYARVKPPPPPLARQQRKGGITAATRGVERPACRAQQLEALTIIALGANADSEVTASRLVW